MVVQARMWACLDPACWSHALTESEPFISTVLAMPSPKRSTVARACCVTKTRSNNKNTTRSLDGLPSLVLLSAFATDIIPKLQADINDRDNLFRFANLAPTCLGCAKPGSRCFAFYFRHGDLEFWASDPSTTSRLGELRDGFP
jgi:hypothetical protein